MSTGRRAGLPGLSRPAAPAPPLARLVRITGPGRQIDIFSHRQLQRWAAAYREYRGLGQPGHQSRSREWTAARQVGPGDTPGCLVGCPGLFPGAAANAPERASGYVPVARPRRQPGRWMLQDCPSPPGRLPPGDLDSVSGWARLYYRRAAELFETATRGMRGGRRTVRR
jgi:hypothetical protein